MVDSVDVGFHIDNVHWAPDGTLLAAGHAGSGPDSIFACLGQGACDAVTSRVAKIIPNSLAKEEIVRYPSNERIILGTVGIQVGDEIWVGGVGGGTRIGRFPAPVASALQDEVRTMTTGIQKFTVFALAILVSWIAGASVPPTWTVNRVTLDVLTDGDGRLYYLSEGSPCLFRGSAHRGGATG